MKNQIEIKPLKKETSATVEIPGSKSYTNRALLLAAIIKNPVKILNPLFSDDTKAMLGCLEGLGVNIIKEEGEIRVMGEIRDIRKGEYNLNARLSGTTIRFILALCSIIPGVKVLKGEEGLNKRPIAELASTLKDLGAEIEFVEKDGYPPLKILKRVQDDNGGVQNDDVRKKIKLRGDISSQFISALMMIAPIIGGLEIEIMGKQISKAFIDMTIAIMEEFGVKVENQNYEKYIIPSGEYQKEEYQVEGDYTSASYFFAVAALTHTRIAVKNLNPTSAQPDKRFVGLLEDMGNKITYGENEVSIEGFGVKPVKVNMESFPDTAQTLAVLASFAKGITEITGIRSLRIKETERILALQTELSKMGIKTESTTDSLTIYGGDPKPATIDTYGDHRMAMAFAVAGTKLPGIKINDPEVVSKTFPDFWEKLKSIGVEIEATGPSSQASQDDISTNVKKINKIFLTGFQTVGKSTLGRLISKKIGWQLVETDKLIEEKAGKSISEITKQGTDWVPFRAFENEVLKDLLKRENIIIDAGGGMAVNEVYGDENKKLLENSEDTLIILLTAPDEVIARRIEKSESIRFGSRPILNTETAKVLTSSDKSELLKTKIEDALEVFEKRKGLYANLADIEIDTSKFFVKGSLDNVCIVIGDPVEHSLSPLMHNMGYKALGVDDKYVYIPVGVSKEKLEKVVELVKTLGIRGVSVTMPHKIEVMKFLDWIDPTAEEINAVNTIVNENGQLKGYNTDWIGIISPLKKTTNLKDKNVAIIGAGGAAKAAVYGLLKEGAEVTIYNRTLEKAQELAKKFSVNAKSLDEIEEIKNADVVINTTPLGMETKEDLSPLPKEYISSSQIVFDTNYNPPKTKLIKDAREQGAKVIYGYEMLLYQGITQFEMYTGMEAPEKEMRNALEIATSQSSSQ